MLPIMGLALWVFSPQPQFDLTYSRDVKPILDAHCVECHHQNGRTPDLEGFPFVAADGADQATIVARILARIEPLGDDPPPRMPAGNRPRLSEADIGLIKDWNSQGLQP